MDVVAASERDKYERMWAHPDYHLGSPGERAVPLFLSAVPVSKGDTIVDAGAGSGRASVALALAGHAVTMLDFCRNAVEPPAQGLPYIDAVLWDLPELSFDWLYCVDVLEHIPREKVDLVLDGLARIASRGGYLQACCCEDNCGALIGETLHLTVEPPDWWAARVALRWPILKDVSSGSYAQFVVGRPYA